METINLVYDLRSDLICKGTIIGNDCHSKYRRSVGIILVNFGYRNVEGITNPSDQGLQNTPFLLERLNHRQIQMNLRYDRYQERLLDRVQSSSLFNKFKELKSITNFEVIVVLKADATFETLFNLARVVLEPLKRTKLTGIN